MRAIPFIIPYHAGMRYAPGPQPNNPGESHLPWAGHSLGAAASPQPWPTVVPSLLLLANNPGTPRERAPIPVVNQYSPLPGNTLYIDGFVGKSKG